MSQPADDPSVGQIANRFTIQLIGIGGIALVILAATGPLGPIALVLAPLANLPILWLLVHATFGAIDDLLTANRAALDGH